VALGAARFSVLIALLPLLFDVSFIPVHPRPTTRVQPTKNLLAESAQEVASERYVAFAVR
jgi:hypothetical protein